jgi:hypothetical protein
MACLVQPSFVCVRSKRSIRIFFAVDRDKL